MNGGGEKKGNIIEDEGVVILCEGIKTNTTLTRLNLRSEVMLHKMLKMLGEKEMFSTRQHYSCQRSENSK